MGWVAIVFSSNPFCHEHERTLQRNGQACLLTREIECWGRGGRRQACLLTRELGCWGWGGRERESEHRAMTRPGPSSLCFPATRPAAQATACKRVAVRVIGSAGWLLKEEMHGLIVHAPTYTGLLTVQCQGQTNRVSKCSSTCVGSMSAQHTSRTNRNEHCTKSSQILNSYPNPTHIKTSTVPNQTQRYVSVAPLLLGARQPPLASALVQGRPGLSSSMPM
jgi:hypothetical protein